ncbi:hypothetical protein R3P38DRAFT_3594692 [Favolaschia claudopus]|uniref:Uncharacterized protein n=1 Tax=Favolaschia claudopus TaxID=2862362 RepID=A0AAW0DKH5_9AGAR
MKIAFFPLVLTVLLSLNAIATPVPDVTVGEEMAILGRMTKVAARLVAGSIAKPVARTLAKPMTDSVGKPAAVPAKAPTKPTAAPANETRIDNRTLSGLIVPRLTAGNEFVGWHGTNSETAALWESRGEIVRPTTKDGKTKGKSGLDAELGQGFYITDTLGTAESAAAINGQNNNLSGKVCAIFAKSSATFRAKSQDKVQIPEIIRGNAKVKNEERASYITILPPRDAGSVERSILVGPLTTGNQMLIPESQNPKFEAMCFDIKGLDSVDAAAFEKSNGKITYTSPSLIDSWNIRKEDVDLAQAIVCALEKVCR